MKKFFSLFSCLFFLFSEVYFCFAAEAPEPSSLHALSACLMDADTGRILYSKESEVFRANASTTKILTCILALEYGNLNDYVTVSKYAASMPDVQLGICTGEQYLLGDLLYSLMLESHNDSAVAIAEHISGSVEAFSTLMNEKARELGCLNTFFLTPNGLDATKTIDGITYTHGTCAADLCRIMSYCIQNPAFLKITRTSSYSFQNYVSADAGNTVPGSRSFTVNNKNAFLTMMDGVLSGKTGFTGNAGYCYVTALQRDNKTFTLALLGCGWPGNKTYKWEDAKLLLSYALDSYHPRDIYDSSFSLPEIKIKNGVADSLSLKTTPSSLLYLISTNDKISIFCECPDFLNAPVQCGDAVGSLVYSINGEIVQKYPVFAAESIKKYTFSYCFKQIFHRFLL